MKAIFEDCFFQGVLWSEHASKSKTSVHSKIIPCICGKAFQWSFAVFALKPKTCIRILFWIRNLLAIVSVLPSDVSFAKWLFFLLHSNYVSYCSLWYINKESLTVSSGFAIAMFLLHRAIAQHQDSWITVDIKLQPLRVRVSRIVSFQWWSCVLTTGIIEITATEVSLISYQWFRGWAIKRAYGSDKLKRCICSC